MSHGAIQKIKVASFFGTRCRCIICNKTMKNYQFNMYLFMLLQTAMTDQARKDRVATP